MSSGAGLLTTALILEHRLPGLTDQQIQELNRPNGLDNFFNPINPKKSFHVISDVLIFSEIALAIGVHGLAVPKKEKKGLLLLTLEGYIINQGIADLFKLAVKRPRPFLLTSPELYDKNETDARLSFYSGHTANAAFFAVTMASSLTKLNMLGKKWAIPLAIAIPITMGVLRIMAGKHYFTDVATGAIIGTGVGLLLPKIHETQIKPSRDESISINFYDSGKIGIFLNFK